MSAILHFVRDCIRLIVVGGLSLLLGTQIYRFFMWLGEVLR